MDSVPRASATDSANATNGHGRRGLIDVGEAAQRSRDAFAVEPNLGRDQDSHPAAPPPAVHMQCDQPTLSHGSANDYMRKSPRSPRFTNGLRRRPKPVLPRSSSASMRQKLMT